MKPRTCRRRLLAEQLESRRLLAGPYAPAAGQIGSTAISMDDPAIVAWAARVASYSPGSNVDAMFQTPEESLGPAEGTIGDVVSLGRGGELTLTFDMPIRDGLGNDFAVFENSVNDTFLELGFVEVSSDGVNFFRFANDSLTAAPVDAFGAVDPTEIHNFAGKYRLGFGTPFDLEELAGTDPALDTTRVTHVRLIDVIGDGSQLDTSGDPIYDPFPTTGSAGLDVDAVGVIHQFESSRDIVGFEDLGATLAPQSAFRGPVPDGQNVTGPFNDTVTVGEFQSEMLTFNNAYSIDFESWNQWAYSNSTNTTTPGFTNQFSSFAGSGAGGSATFGIGFPDQSGFFDPPTVTRDLGDDRQFESIWVTNTTYAAISMREGDGPGGFAKKFGGDSGNDEDFLLLTVTGKDAAGDAIGTVDFYLADYRFADNSLDYIVDRWVNVDLHSIAEARSLEFSIASSDVGAFGINTPAYFAVDDVTLSRPVLLADLADRSAVESDGDDATFLRISRPDQDTSQSIAVTLVSDRPGRAIPRTTDVTIAAGERYVEVPVDLIDNDLADGDVTATITASASGFVSDQVTLLVADDESKQLTLALDKSSVDEGSTLTLTVDRNADLGAPLSVRVQSSDANVFALDQTITIDAGMRTTSFAVAVPDDDTDRPDAQILLTASASGYLSGSSFVNVIDNDVAALRLTTSVNVVPDDPAPADATLELIGRTLPPDSFDDGRDGPMPMSSGFRSGALDFNNVYDPTFASWSGWAVSNTTDTTTPGFTNQFSSYAGGGALNSDTYLVGNAFPGFVVPVIRRDASSGPFHSIQITNATYAALSMRDGDSFAKKFGGATGDDPDFFKLTIEGVDQAGTAVGSIDFYLADYRFADNSMDYIIDQWTNVDLTTLPASAVELRFALNSSDVGMFGMNTPAYFAADHVALVESNRATFTIERNTSDLTEPLGVRLVSDQVGKARVPASVTIPSGQSSVTHPIKIIHDTLVDADAPVTIDATADGFGSAAQTVTVSDGDLPRITTTLLSDTIDEAAGSVTAVVHRNVVDTDQSLQVSLQAPDDLMVPAAVTIPAGSRSVTFTVVAVDNDRLDGARHASVSATAPGFPDSQSNSIRVIDDDVPPLMLTLQIERPSLSEADASPTIDFEDVGRQLTDESFYNGSDLAGGFVSGPGNFNNEFDPTFGSWSGWAVSNTRDAVTPGFLNQYSAKPGRGALGSDTYAVANAFPGSTVPTISFPAIQNGQRLESLMVTNTTYTAESMRVGDAFAKKFGGQSGDDPDFLKLTIADNTGSHVVEFYLADFRFADNSLDYIIDEWTEVDLSSFPEGTTGLSFSLSSSDNGPFGMNTPAYFAIDNLVISGADPVAARATLSRNDLVLDQALEVRIEVDDATELIAPRTITFVPGVDTVSFDLRAANDFRVDGDQVVTVTASAPTHSADSAMITIEDDDVLALTASLLSSSVIESDGAAATRLVVHRNSEDVSQSLEVAVAVSSTEVVVAETLVLQGGQRSAAVDVGVMDNPRVDGDRIVSLQVDSDGFAGSSVDLHVSDNETAGLILSPFNDASPIREGDLHRVAYVSLVAQPLSDVVVVAAIEAVSENLDDRFDLPSPLIFTPQDWDVPRLVSLRPSGDLRVEEDQFFSLVFEASFAESDPAFHGVRRSMQITLQDVQPSEIRVYQNGNAPAAIDAATGVVLVEGSSADGIQVIANEFDQALTLEPLDQTQGVILLDLRSGDDVAVLRSGRFTLVHGGDGWDSVVLDYAATFELADFMDNRVVGFEQLVLTSGSVVTIDPSSLERVTTGTGSSLLIRKPSGASLRFIETPDARLQPGMQMHGDDPVQVVRTDTHEVHVVSSTPWQNAYKRWDVNQSNQVTSADALVVINALHRMSDPLLPTIDSLDVFTGFYVDVNGDGRLTSVDALHVINEVARLAERPEGEPIADMRAEVDASDDARPVGEPIGLPAPPRKIVSSALDPRATDAAISELMPVNAAPRDDDAGDVDAELLVGFPV